MIKFLIPFLLLLTDSLIAQISVCDSIYSLIESKQSELSYEEMILLFEKGLPNCIEQNLHTKTSEYLISLSYLYYDSKEYQKLELALEQEKVLLEKQKLPVSHRASYLNNASLLELKKGNIFKANSLLLESIDAQKEFDNDPFELSDIYYNLASNYESIGDYKNALSFSKKSLELKSNINNYTDKLSQYNLEVANAHYRYALSNSKLKNYDRSIDNLKISLDYLNDVNGLNLLKVKKTKIKALHALIQNIIRKGDLESAKIYLKKCKKIQEDLDYREYKTSELSGLILYHTNNYQPAKKSLIKALNEALDYYSGINKMTSIGRIYSEISECYLKQDSVFKSLEFIHSGLKYFDPQITQDLLKNPKVERIQNTNQVLLLLEKKAELAYLIYKKYDDAKYLEISSESYKQATLLLDRMRTSYITTGSKFFIVQKAYPIYENYILVLAEKYRLEKSSEIIEELFFVFEKNKSTILFESLSEKFNLFNSELPDSIKASESDFKSNISFYSKLLDENKVLSSQNEKKIVEIENKLFELNQDYSVLREKIKSDYPKYFQVSNQFKSDVQTKSIQNSLKHDELVLEYFQGENSLFCLGLSQGKVEFIQENKNFTTETDKIFNLISTKPDRDSKQELEDLSYSLYQDILNPMLEKFEGIRHLLIIADGTIAKIPLEILMFKEDNNQVFLVEKYEISYLYSTEQLFTPRNEKKNKVESISFAPNFSGNFMKSKICKNLNELPFSKDEIMTVHKLLKGSILMDENASRQKFLDNISKFDIVHLATHACLNTANPSLSEIHFSDGYLTNYDIENLNVRPKLVVLSACNTGQGEIKKGEGIVSLTRGFFEAGVKSLQSSLWSINDFSSSEIMKGMYSNLKKGESRSNALRQSKIDYLEQADKVHRHPFYWAGIIHIGEYEPLFYKKYKNLGWLLIFLMIPIFIMIGIKKSATNE